MPRISHAILGFVLVGGGAVTFYNASISPHGDDLPLSTLLVAEVYCLGGLWLLAGIELERTRPFATAAAVGLSASSLYLGLAGRCDSGLLGINPWYSLAIYQAIAINLILWRAPVSNAAKYWATTPYVAGLMVMTILIGIVGAWRAPFVAIAGVMLWYISIFDLFAVTGMMLWRSIDDRIDLPWDSSAYLMGLMLMAVLGIVMGATPRPLVSVTGTAVLEGQPLKEASLMFYRERIPVVEVRTGLDGQFLLPPILPGTYQVSISEGIPPRLPRGGLSNPISPRKESRPPRRRTNQGLERSRTTGKSARRTREPNRAADDWISGLAIITKCTNSNYVFKLYYSGSYGDLR